MIIGKVHPFPEDPQVLSIAPGGTVASLLRLRTAAAIKWSAALPEGHYGISLGNDHVYVLETDSSGRNGQAIHVYKADTGDLLRTARFPTGFHTQRLMPFDGGVFAVDTGTAVAYMSADGRTVTTHTVPENYIGEEAAVTADGRAYALVSARDDRNRTSIAAFSPDNGMNWIKLLPDVMQSVGFTDPLVATTADGGALVAGSSAGWTDGMASAVTKFAPDGGNSWTRHSLSGNVVALHGTSNGRFIVGAADGSSCDSSSPWGCVQLVFATYDQKTGDKVSTIAQVGGADSTEYYAFTGSLAVEGDRFYASTRRVDGKEYGHGSVLAFAGSDLGRTYPEDAVRATVTVDPGPTPYPARAKITSVTSAVTPSTPRWNLDLSIGLQQVPWSNRQDLWITSS
ncbi:hypothetical protein OHB01_12895 [Microbispora hainanensis]|uniref:hypothetical protein n=1 Tax=Microbispora hainanensis TaxID=568844 RepID=UPI002E2A310E|nr:hypothetical protein [Microbispora hainanensis]